VRVRRPGVGSPLAFLAAALLTLTGPIGLSIAVEAVAPRTAVRVLAPTLFAGWQTRNVSDPVVVRDAVGGGLRMYYSGSATEQASDAAWDLWATGAALSPDGRRWTWLRGGYEPVLRGHRFLEGDVVADARTAFDALEARVGAVIREGARWRMWYTGWNGDDRAVGAGRFEKVHFRIGAAVSDDGPGYRMWYEAYDGTAWRVAQAESADGVRWTKAGVAIEPGPAGALDERGARHPVVIALRSGYELWYQGRSAASPEFHVLRARSADGRAWLKIESEITLHPDPPAKGDEDVRVGSVLRRADGGREVYFAKETAVPRAAAFGAVETRTTAIWAEVVGVRE
jgi:hypothetical protein